MLERIQARAKAWTGSAFDEETRNQVQNLMQHTNELIDSFYKDLEFGTGGLRGLMGPGTNRVNRYTVGMATQGLSQYLKKNFSSLPEIRVVVGHDSRNNSALFARTVAGVFAANGIKVFLFDALRPTPEISFAIRHLGCQGGVVITASHNPKEYNGYKAYWSDGAQVIPPHDTNIIHEVGQVSVQDVRFDGPEDLITQIGEEIDQIYTDKIVSLSLSPEAIARNRNIRIVYTPIHGTGVKLIPMCLNKLGFNNIIHIPEQDVPDGNFPTVKSPNPEEPAALNMAIQKARETDADIVMGSDPDADRIGLAVKDTSGNWVLLNGNQAASILIYYLIRRWKETGKLQGKEYIVKTIVTSELLSDIATRSGVASFDVLTGFKWIADIIAQKEGGMTFIGGGEESYGYLCGTFVRDKDAVMSASLFAEIAAWAADQGKTLYDILLDIYLEFGLYKETGISVVKKGKSGAEEIRQMMESYRQSPPKTINQTPVVRIMDYQSLTTTDLPSGAVTRIDSPASDVLQFFTGDGSKISVRPSGTEPKIKYYIGVRAPLASREEFAQTNALLEQKIQGIVADLNPSV